MAGLREGDESGWGVGYFVPARAYQPDGKVCDQASTGTPEHQGHHAIA